MAGRLKRTGRRALTRLRGTRHDKSTGMPGPSHDPSTNLVMADVAIRIGTYLARRSVERSFLKGRYGKETARDILRNRSLGQTLFSVALARLATNSLPGAAIVSTGMAAKVLLERSRSRRAERAEGDKELLEQARGE